jgi:hypothetical protein
MEKALRGDKVSHIYFIVKLVLTCVGLCILGFGLLAIGVAMGGLPIGSRNNSLDGLNIIFGVVGFILIAYCVIIFAIATAYSLVPILVGSSLKKKFLRTSNPKFIRDSLLLKGLFLLFGLVTEFSIVVNLFLNELTFTAFGALLLVIADVAILVFVWIDYSDASSAYKEYKNYQAYSQSQSGMSQYNEQFNFQSRQESENPEFVNRN